MKSKRINMAVTRKMERKVKSFELIVSNKGKLNNMFMIDGGVVFKDFRNCGSLSLSIIYIYVMKNKPFLVLDP